MHIIFQVKSKRPSDRPNLGSRSFPTGVEASALAAICTDSICHPLCSVPYGPMATHVVNMATEGATSSSVQARMRRSFNSYRQTSGNISEIKIVHCSGRIAFNHYGYWRDINVID
jgi:hypothetical protein